MRCWLKEFVSPKPRFKGLLPIYGMLVVSLETIVILFGVKLPWS